MNLKNEPELYYSKKEVDKLITSQKSPFDEGLKLAQNKNQGIWTPEGLILPVEESKPVVQAQIPNSSVKAISSADFPSTSANLQKENKSGIC